MFRKLVVSLALSVGVCLASIPAYADSGPALGKVEQCIKAIVGSAHSMTYDQALKCAPSGAQVVKTSRGYAITQTQSARMPLSAASASCATIYHIMYDDGVTDWLGARFCWDYYTVWVSSGPWAGCSAYLLGAGCFHQDAWVVTASGRDALVAGNFYQSCAFWIPCNDGEAIEVWANGSNTWWWWTF